MGELMGINLMDFLFTAINMFILFFAVGYFGGDMISKFLKKRKDGIVERIETAKMEKDNAIFLKADYEQKIRNFEDEKTQILVDARKKAKLREEEIIASANIEALRIIRRADKESELKKKKLRDDIKRDMINYATAAAARVVAENMDSARHAAMVEQTLSEMGETTWQD